MQALQACTAGRQNWQERHQTQIKNGHASQILRQEAAVAYEAKAKRKTQQIKKLLPHNAD